MPDSMPDFTPFDIWKKGGVTEHLGGVFATRRLLAGCRLAPGQRVLDIGCGTGTTTRLLAETYGVQVTALDLLPQNLRTAQQRVNQPAARARISWLCADAHRLPFPDGIFDAVVVESVIVFCAASAVMGEIHRVLKDGGVFGANEFTFLKPPPPELPRLLADLFGIHALQEQAWKALLAEAGFVHVTAEVRPIRLWEQMRSHLAVDGVGAYFNAMAAGIKDDSIRRTFFTREMLSAARRFFPYVGYGLYRGDRA
ncbi:MAG: methyltransferase domain-containing protein [Anaerolineaceae bacterium]